MAQVERDAAAHPAPGEVDHVVHQRRDPLRAAVHAVEDRHQGHVRTAPPCQFEAAQYGPQRRTEVVSEDGNELLSQFGGLLLVHQQAVGIGQFLLAGELGGNQLREQRHGGTDIRRRQHGRLGVKPTQRAEILAVGAKNGHGYIALKAVDPGSMVIAISFVVAHAVDDYRLPGIAYDCAQRGRHVQGVADLETEIEIVENGAGCPAVVGDAGDADEAEPGCCGHGFKQCRYSADGLH